MTRQIVAALSLNLTQGDRQRLMAEHTNNLEAFDCFLRGRELWWRHTKEANGQARDLLMRAIDLDPNFAPAYAFLAAAHVHDYLAKGVALDIPAAPERGRGSWRCRLPCRVHLGGAFHERLL